MEEISELTNKYSDKCSFVSSSIQLIQLIMAIGLYRKFTNVIIFYKSIATTVLLQHLLLIYEYIFNAPSTVNTFLIIESVEIHNYHTVSSKFWKCKLGIQLSDTSVKNSVFNCQSQNVRAYLLKQTHVWWICFGMRQKPWSTYIMDIFLWFP